MTDWFCLLPFMVLGFCDALDRISRGNKMLKYSHALIDSPKCVLPENAHSRVVRPLRNRWFHDGSNNLVDSHRGRRALKDSGITAEHANPGDPDNGNKDFQVIKPNGDDYNFKNRRFFWEPIFDGNIIGSIGSLFSDKIKEEADREREEREKIRGKTLVKKYSGMLNNPEQYAELEQESENSDKYVNQIIRRSFLPSSNEPIDKNVPRKLSTSNRFNLDRWNDGQKNLNHRDDDGLFKNIARAKSVTPFNSQMLQNSDIRHSQMQRLPMDSSRHKTLLTSRDRTKNGGKTGLSARPPDFSHFLIYLWV